MSSESSRISAKHMERIIEKLMCQQMRQSTSKTYLSIWHQFNQFLLKLDHRPSKWEDCTTLFIGYMVENGYQSSTVKSYVSAIKKMLLLDGYKWNDKDILLTSLTRACKLKNDVVKTRLPIHCGLLEMVLFEVQRLYADQPYLQCMYKALFGMGYYGLMRVGELTCSQHVVRACNVHLAKNKDKLLVVLYSSKTHDEGMRPQKIKITANKMVKHYKKRNFCPFKLLRNYIASRGAYKGNKDQFFVFGDGSTVYPTHARKTLRSCLKAIGVNEMLYDMHSLRIGRTSDLIKFNYPIEVVKRMGRWRSNVIYKYIRQCFGVIFMTNHDKFLHLILGSYLSPVCDGLISMVDSA